MGQLELETMLIREINSNDPGLELRVRHWKRVFRKQLMKLGHYLEWLRTPAGQAYLRKREGDTYDGIR